MKKLFVSIIMASLAVWTYAQNDCLSAKISGAHQVEPGISETYTHSFPSTGVENFIWKVEGAAMVDGLEITQYPNGQITKKGTSLDIIWDGTPTGKVIVRQEIPCQALANKPEIEFPITKIPTDPGSGGGVIKPTPSLSCKGLGIAPNSWKEYKTDLQYDPSTVELCGYNNLLIPQKVTSKSFYGQNFYGVFNGAFNGPVNGTSGLFSGNVVVGGSLSVNGSLNLGSFTTQKLGVGVSSVSADYAVEVCGNIRAKEVVIETDWCDFVFDKDYHLRPLTEVELFIKENHHLPDVPSAKEVEENGVSLGETEAILLRKIEELTLYILEQEKRINALEHKLQK